MESALDIAGGKARQFSIPTIDRSFEIWKPRPPLSKFVDTLWLCDGDHGDLKPGRILPTGTLEIAINLKQRELRFRDAKRQAKPDRFSCAVVSGATGRGFAPDPDDSVFIIGVHFKPGGAFPFIGVPADDLADIHVDLETLWGYSTRHLCERLREATTTEQRFRILENELLRRLSDRAEQHYAVTAALETFTSDHGAVTVRRAAEDLGLSQRRFIHVFKREVGITPKLFSRIQRFQSVRASLQSATCPDWTELALEHGYVDQSHLIREFVEFSGTTPVEHFTFHRSNLRGGGSILSNTRS